MGMRIEVTPERLIIHGRTRTYYAKQLALHAIRELDVPCGIWDISSLRRAGCERDLA